MMSSELGSHPYQCLRAVDLDETEGEWGSGGVVERAESGGEKCCF